MRDPQVGGLRGQRLGRGDPFAICSHRSIGRDAAKVDWISNEVNLTGAKIDAEVVTAKEVQPKQPIDSRTWW